jgi:hypothetical protein
VGQNCDETNYDGEAQRCLRRPTPPSWTTQGLALRMPRDSCVVACVETLASLPGSSGAIRCHSGTHQGREVGSDPHEHCAPVSFGITLSRLMFFPAKNCHGRGRGFESRRPRHSLPGVTGRDTGNSNPCLSPVVQCNVRIIPARGNVLPNRTQNRARKDRLGIQDTPTRR